MSKILLIKLKPWDWRIFTNTCSNTYQKPCRASSQQALCWLHPTHCHDFAPSFFVSELRLFFALAFQNLAKGREQCVPPFASQPAIVSSKHFGLKVIKVNCNEQVNYFQIMGAMNEINWILNSFLITPFPCRKSAYKIQNKQPKFRSKISQLNINSAVIYSLYFWLAFSFLLTPAIVKAGAKIVLLLTWGGSRQERDSRARSRAEQLHAGSLQSQTRRLRSQGSRCWHLPPSLLHRLSWSSQG